MNEALGRRVDPVESARHQSWRQVSMLRRWLFLCTFCAAWPMALAAHAQPPAAAEQLAAAMTAARRAGVRWTQTTLAAPELAQNVEGRRGELSVGLHLPADPSACNGPAHPCALVVFLPGFGTSPLIYGPANNAFFQAVDAAVDADRLPPLLVVVVDGRTRLGGGWYVDSPSTGAWTTLLAERLLPALGAATGQPGRPVVLAGHSMGGFGALHVAMAWPSVVAGVVSISPVVRSRVLAERLLPVVSRAHPRTPPTLVETWPRWSKSTFSEKLTWALLAAWAPAPEAPMGAPAQPFEPDGPPWRLRANFAKLVARFDVPDRLAGLDAATARKLPRVYLAIGRNDGLTPEAHLQAVARAWAKASHRPKSVRLRVHAGDHASRMVQDFLDGLAFVLQASP